MKHFAKLIFSSGQPAQGAKHLSAPAVREHESPSVSMWDEVLAAGMCDESARMCLDLWGPRSK